MKFPKTKGVTDRYQLGSRSAIEWIIDRYYIRTDKASGIVNDPNVWSREHNDPRYIIACGCRGPDRRQFAGGCRGSAG